MSHKHTHNTHLVDDDLRKVTPNKMLHTHLVDDDLRKVVLLVATVTTVVVLLVRRLVLAAHQLALGAVAVLPRGLLHAAADHQGLGQ